MISYVAISSSSPAIATQNVFEEAVMLLEGIWSAVLESELSYASGRFAQYMHVTDKSLKMERKFHFL